MKVCIEQNFQKRFDLGGFLDGNPRRLECSNEIESLLQTQDTVEENSIKNSLEARIAGQQREEAIATLEQLREDTYNRRPECLRVIKNTAERREKYHATPVNSKEEKIALMQYSAAEMKEQKVLRETDNADPKIQQAKHREAVAKKRHQEITHNIYAKSPERDAIETERRELRASRDALDEKIKRANPEKTQLLEKLREENWILAKKREQTQDNLEKAKQNLKTYIDVLETPSQSSEWNQIETYLDNACIALAVEYTKNIEVMREQFTSLITTITPSK